VCRYPDTGDAASCTDGGWTSPRKVSFWSIKGPGTSALALDLDQEVPIAMRGTELIFDDLRVDDRIEEAIFVDTIHPFG